eukprot:9497542-Pyramimonas_sp.AAC.1
MVRISWELACEVDRGNATAATFEELAMQRTPTQCAPPVASRKAHSCMCACVYVCAVCAVWCAVLSCDVLRHCGVCAMCCGT